MAKKKTKQLSPALQKFSKTWDDNTYRLVCDFFNSIQNNRITEYKNKKGKKTKNYDP